MPTPAQRRICDAAPCWLVGASRGLGLLAARRGTIAWLGRAARMAAAAAAQHTLWRRVHGGPGVPITPAAT